MTVLFIVIPVALVASATAVMAFIWATRSGQFDDLTTPAVRMLEPDEVGCPQGPTSKDCEDAQ